MLSLQGAMVNTWKFTSRPSSDISHHFTHSKSYLKAKQCIRESKSSLVAFFSQVNVKNIKNPLFFLTA